MSLETMISDSACCVKCGSLGVGTCDCWEPCPCGWTKERGEECNNPECYDRVAKELDAHLQESLAIFNRVKK